MIIQGTLEGTDVPQTSHDEDLPSEMKQSKSSQASVLFLQPLGKTERERERSTSSEEKKQKKKRSTSPALWGENG